MPGDSVLIVDDNPTNLKLLRVLLTAEGFDVRTASTSEEALTILEDFHPRLVLTDIQLPGMDGLEFTRRLKSNPATRDIIVLAITGYAMTGDEEAARRAGCNGYVTKPVDTRTLPATVRLYLESRQAARPALQAGDYHDMLADLRTSFLVQGEEEGNEFLHRLRGGFDADRAERIAHRWAGIAATLGFIEIAATAHRIQDFLANSGAQPIRVSGEGFGRLRAELLSILHLFSDAIRGKRETPDLPRAVWQVLSNKMFAVVGFERPEAARITGALADARSLAHVFPDVPDAAALQPFHAAILNVCQGRSLASWIQTGIFAGSGKPILFVGSAEALLRREPTIPERTCDFLLGPWDNDELVFRAYRLFSSPADYDGTGPSKLHHGMEPPPGRSQTVPVSSPGDLSS